MTETKMPPVYAVNLVTNSVNTAYRVESILYLWYDFHM